MFNVWFTRAAAVSSAAEMHRLASCAPNAVQVDTSDAATALLPAGGTHAPLTVVVFHMRSWRQLGSALVECISGCNCAPKVIHGNFKGWTTEKRSSRLHVEASPQYNCTIRFTTRAEDTGSMFKICGVGVTWGGKLSSATHFRPHCASKPSG